MGRGRIKDEQIRYRTSGRNTIAANVQRTVQEKARRGRVGNAVGIERVPRVLVKLTIRAVLGINVVDAARVERGRTTNDACGRKRTGERARARMVRTSHRETHGFRTRCEIKLKQDRSKRRKLAGPTRANENSKRASVGASMMRSRYERGKETAENKDAPCTS